MFYLPFNERSYEQTLAKLHSFRRLPEGWHLGQSSPIGLEVIGSAEAILDFGHRTGFSHSDAFPGPDGEVMVAFYNAPDFCVQVSVERRDEFEITFERGDQEVSCETFANLLTATNHIAMLYGEIWQLYAGDSTSRITMTPIAASLSTTRSSRHRMGADYQYLTSNVQSKPVVALAATCNNTIQVSSGFQEHIGDSTQEYSQALLAS